MLRILESQAPAKQTATDTIQTYSSRLSTATLLEDRRIAITGLRSFAKTHPASVASGALRDLIACLKKDADDPDTVKLVLETLLILFEPGEQSLEASEEITLWQADELTQKEENVNALLELVASSEFYLRLYALQILSHVSNARPERTQEAVLASALGVSHITAVLDDRREAVRNEALILLVALTPTSAELQKMVAFENAFDRVFVLINNEGALTHGSTTVQDCLSLLANLLKLNTKNQLLFRETAGMGKLSRLLVDALAEENSAEGVSDWMKPQRDMNVWGLLMVTQLFLAPGSPATKINQEAFWKNGLVRTLLQLGFSKTLSNSIRSKSLETCGSIISANKTLQEQFGDLGVQLQLDEEPVANGHATPGLDGKTPATKPKYRAVNVIEALLELVLAPASVTLFDVRIAASNCLKAFFEGHNGICGHVVRRAIEGHQSGNDKIPNILTVLLETPTARTNSDPYQQWMAAVLLLHLLHDNPETKATALKVEEGDAESGEEVVTFVQSLASNVIAGALRPEDERALLGHLMLLTIWLFEDPDAINDLLSEGSNVQGLINVVKTANATMPLVAGLSAYLLGVVYEFSTKDSPVTRKVLHELLNDNLGRDMYIDRLTRLRENPHIRDFEVLPQTSGGSLPEVYLDKVFVDFVKDNFSRFLRAIDRDPTFEVSIVSHGVQKGVSRELVDNLRAEVEGQKRALEQANSSLVQLKARLEQEELDHRRTRDTSTAELARIKHINQSLHSNHEDEVKNLKTGYAKEKTALIKHHEDEKHKRRTEHTTALDAMRRQAEMQQQTAERQRQNFENERKKAHDELTQKHSQEIATLSRQNQAAREKSDLEIQELKRAIQEVEARLQKSDQQHVQDLKVAQEDFDSRSSALQKRLRQAEERVMQSELQAAEAIASVEQFRKEKKDVQTELDDLLVVFGDLEAKRTSDKARLKALGEEVSDDEDEGEAEDDDGDEEVEEGEGLSDKPDSDID